MNVRATVARARLMFPDASVKYTMKPHRITVYLEEDANEEAATKRAGILLPTLPKCCELRVMVAG